MNWIQLPDHQWNGIVVHEVKCPICKYKETYHDLIPRRCYICDIEMDLMQSIRTNEGAVMKPILFNTEMVRAIIEGRKTVTRRVIKLWHRMPPYRVGDTLYIRETWREYNGKYFFKANEPREYDDYKTNPKWKPSIHMPKEAARIFLKVTDVRVERLQDIDGHGIAREGVDNGKSNPSMGVRWENMQRLAFEELWNSTIKKKDLDVYGWDANPWVWVIEFERIEKGE